VLLFIGQGVQHEWNNVLNNSLNLIEDSSRVPCGFDMNLILIFFRFASVQSLLRRDKVAVGCAQDDGVHAKHGRMQAESRLMRHPMAMAHDKRRCGRSARPLLESQGRTSPGGLALATGL
jgi:hypothetical protein